MKKQIMQKVLESLSARGAADLRLNDDDTIERYAAGGHKFKFSCDDLNSRLVCECTSLGKTSDTLSAAPTVGEICRGITLRMEAADRIGDPPPESLGGNGKDLETLLMQEASRHEKVNLLTMGRYGTNVSLVDGEWLPIPSLPDFEGVLYDGRQFVIEAKVVSVAGLRMRKDQIKHKQVKHMLKRSRFKVPCFVLIHFNARTGKTFYEPPFTTAVPVKAAADGGWHVWEKFAEEKDKSVEMEILSREKAREIGIPITWHTPGKCKKSRPDFLSILAEKPTI